MRDSSVDTRPVGLSAWEVSPGDDAVECSVTDQGAPGVTLSGGRERNGGRGGAKQRHKWGHMGESERRRHTEAEIMRDRTQRGLERNRKTRRHREEGRKRDTKRKVELDGH